MSLFLRALMCFSLPLFLWGCDNSSTTNATKPALTRIHISPLQVTSSSSDLTLAAGNKLTFTAVGYYADGSSVELTDLVVDNWQSSDNQSGLFDKPGELTAGNKPGAVDVYVIKDDIRSNTVPVTVTSAVITSIAVTPR